MEAMADWHDSVFLISSSPGASEKMLELCGMFLLPRTDLAPARTHVFCDKVDDHYADVFADSHEFLRISALVDSGTATYTICT